MRAFNRASGDKGDGMSEMSDREILLLAYGAIKASQAYSCDKMAPIIKIIEEHLFPPATPEPAKPKEAARE